MNKTEKSMKLFGRKAGQKLFISLAELAQFLKRSKGGVLSTAAKLVDRNQVVGLRNRAGEMIYACRVPRLLKYFSSELIENLSDEKFNLVGKWLESVLSSKTKFVMTARNLIQFQEKLEMPALFIQYFIQCFIDFGLVRIDDGLVLTKGNSELSASSLRKMFIGRKLVGMADEAEVLSDSDPFRVLEKLHKNHDEKTKMVTIPVEVEDCFRIQHICEIKIGHQDCDWVELEATIAALEATLPENRPTILVVSGLIQGAFQHVQKSRRTTLVKGLRSEREQLKLANQIMKRVSNLGIKVVLNLGDDDKVWCENTATFMIQAIEALDKKGKLPSDQKKKSAHFMNIDRMKSGPLWDMVYSFVWQVGLEYQIRVGRRFYSADEVQEKTGGSHMEESLLLLHAYQTLVQGGSFSQDHSVLEIDKIPLPGKIFSDFTVVDDCKFDVLIKEKSTKTVKRISVMEKHFFRLSATSMIGDPTAAIRAITAQLNSMKGQKPDVFFVEHEQTPFVVSTKHTLVASVPGMQKIKIDRKSENALVSADPSHRVATTRKEVFCGQTMPMAFYPDGSFEVSLRSGHYMEKASISDQRICIMLFFDWQIGSVTANCDLQAIYMDYALHHIMPRYPTWFMYGGDHIHGFNYPGFAFESGRMGLISIDAQKEFNKRLICYPLSMTPKAHLRNYLKYVGIIPGNHEWNSGTKNYGTIHCDHIKSAFELAFVHAGIFTPIGASSDAVPKVEIVSSSQDDSGNHYKAWVINKEIGGYGVRVQHLIVERGAKGQGGPPVYALKSQLNGNSESFKTVDFLATGHWHSPMLWKLANTTAMITGSLAGISGYEYMRGMCATTGCSMIFLGGGLPPTIRFMNVESLAKYKPQGFYSAKNLAQHGYRDDDGFNRLKHGFSRFKGRPQSAIQKFLWNQADELGWGEGHVLS
jgi:hypothetical protein